jgi:hypothetical protein
MQITQLDNTVSPIIAGGSTNTGNAQVVATLAAAAGKTNYLEGFDIGGGGATAASVIEVVVAGLAGGSIKFEVPIAAGVTAGAIPLTGVYSVRFPSPIPASGLNTAITVTVPAMGSGNTNAHVTAYGYTKQ